MSQVPAPAGDEVERLLQRLTDGGADALPIALACLATPSAGELRARAVALVRRYPDAVVALLDAEELGARVLAATGMAVVQVAAALPRLQEMLAEPQPELRCAALTAVVACQQDQARACVLAALSDTEPAVRCCAARLLGQFARLPRKKLKSLLAAEVDAEVQLELRALLQVARRVDSRSPAARSK